MSTQHTPGPWSASFKPQPNGCPIVGANGLMVAMLAHSINHKDQSEIAMANARLIAAAPDLLSALEMARALMVCVDGYKEGGSSVRIIDAAIAKALATPPTEPT